ncbi:hypothetical protein DL95DRAFT_398199 [Leptodontidium sp. 2 PMI_412]|nr:hypothetical protein DL95DRAFT_398199 [Leptodontidium sp. 2 PMI_412]
MAPLATFLKVSSVFAILTGTGDVLDGLKITERLTGVALPIDSPAAVLADNHFRFLGAYWAGYGAMLWWVSNDLTSRRVPLAILGGIFFVSGIRRSISAAFYGMPGVAFGVATAVEFVVPPAVWLLGGW